MPKAKQDNTNDSASGDEAATQPEMQNPDPKPYTADFDVYLDGVYTKAGNIFVTANDPADGWNEVPQENVPAIEASTNKVPGDPSLENLDVPALQALAATKNVPTIGIEDDKDKLITAIKAANEPHL